MEITLIELMFKGIPEAAIFTLGLYAFSKKKIETKQYGAIAIMSFVSVYLLRLMPINYSVNIMINVIFCTVLGMNVLKINLFQSLKANLLIFSVILACEATNIFLLQIIFGSQIILEIMAGDPITKVIYTIPSTIFFGAVIATVYYFNVLKVSREKKTLNFEKER